jgi:hypothetical protein
MPLKTASRFLIVLSWLYAISHYRFSSIPIYLEYWTATGLV